MDSARSLAAATGTPMPATALPRMTRHCPCMARDGRATARRSAAEPVHCPLLRRRAWPGMLQDASFFHPAATLSAASAA